MADQSDNSPKKKCGSQYEDHNGPEFIPKILALLFG